MAECRRILRRRVGAERAGAGGGREERAASRGIAMGDRDGGLVLMVLGASACCAPDDRSLVLDLRQPCRVAGGARGVSSERIISIQRAEA